LREPCTGCTIAVVARVARFDTVPRRTLDLPWSL
jgi:hypothetical protein